jgi:hypothetical protein
MARQGYQRLSLADVDEIWKRLRSGHPVKPTARALGLPTSTVRTYLIRCGGIRPDPRHRGAGRLSLGRARGDQPWFGCRPVTACDCRGVGPVAVDGQP